MNVDLYSWGDPWDDRTWSGIPREVATTFERLGVLQNGYDVLPLGGHAVTHLPFYRFGADTDEASTTGLGSVRDQHPAFRRVVEWRARRLHRRSATPDAVLTTGDFAVFESTPYFVYTDVTIPSILDFRSREGTTYLFDQYPDALLRRREAFESTVYGNAAGVFVAGERVAESMVESYGVDPDRVHSVGFGHRYPITAVDDATVDARLGDPEVLFIGRDGRRKGADLLIDAYRRLGGGGTRLTLVTERESLPASLVEFCDRDPSVTLHDVLPPAELEPLYRRASVFAMPSRYEPWGKVFFEAMSFGLPVIGADRCAMPKFIEDGSNGYLAPLDPAGIADRIRRVHADREAYATMAHTATEVAAGYTWERVAGQMVDAIRETVEE